MFNHGTGIVCWSSKKQTTVVLSTTEAKYGALCSGCCHGVWTKEILLDCNILCDEPIQVWCDNRSCIEIAKNSTLHGRAKHMDIKLHYIWDLVVNKEVVMNFYRIDIRLLTSSQNVWMCINIVNSENIWVYASFNQEGKLLGYDWRREHWRWLEIGDDEVFCEESPGCAVLCRFNKG